MGNSCVFTDKHDEECVLSVLGSEIWKESVTSAMIFGILFSMMIFDVSRFFFTFCSSVHCRKATLVLFGGKATAQTVYIEFHECSFCF